MKRSRSISRPAGLTRRSSADQLAIELRQCVGQLVRLLRAGRGWRQLVEHRRRHSPLAQRDQPGELGVVEQRRREQSLRTGAKAPVLLGRGRTPVVVVDLVRADACVDASGGCVLPLSKVVRPVVYNADQLCSRPACIQHVGHVKLLFVV